MKETFVSVGDMKLITIRINHVLLMPSSPFHENLIAAARLKPKSLINAFDI